MLRCRVNNTSVELGTRALLLNSALSCCLTFITFKLPKTASRNWKKKKKIKTQTFWSVNYVESYTRLFRKTWVKFGLKILFIWTQSLLTLDRHFSMSFDHTLSWGRFLSYKNQSNDLQSIWCMIRTSVMKELNLIHMMLNAQRCSWLLVF